MENQEGLNLVLAKLEEMENRFDKMENRFDKMESKIDKIEAKVNSLEVTVKEIQEDTKITRSAVNALIEQTQKYPPLPSIFSGKKVKHRRPS